LLIPRPAEHWYPAVTAAWNTCA